MLNEAPKDLVYCTAGCRAMLSSGLSTHFRNLDELILDVAGSAVERLVIVSPYLGVGALPALRTAAAVSAERGAWVRLVTDLSEAVEANGRALAMLVQGENGRTLRRRLRVLSGAASFPSLLHAKMVIADGRRGYLGSANLSGRGFDENLEVGVALMPRQARVLDELVTVLESRGFLQDNTRAILPPF